MAPSNTPTPRPFAPPEFREFEYVSVAYAKRGRDLEADLDRWAGELRIKLEAQGIIYPKDGTPEEKWNALRQFKSAPTPEKSDVQASSRPPVVKHEGTMEAGEDADLPEEFRKIVRAFRIALARRKPSSLK
jgi:hypothetical protein